ncbi:MAG: glycoside hydrolase family 3 protein [Prolixibacteraceae bacterium]|jgi:beta-N-acetylhexosaminidase|nr:glycoside hydrolase family 3 protein [Prolixibacteraceae bacterium]
MRIHFLPLLLLFVILFSGCEEDFEQPPTLDEQIGQMLLVGFRGTELNDDNPIIHDLEQYNLGGVIIYEKDGPTQSRPRNVESPEQLRQLVADLKSFSHEPLFVAIDEEGGVVTRLKEQYGFPATVTAEYLGEINREDTTRFYAGRIAATLSEMGINMNFAPVVDVNVNPESPAIGALGRSFSANPDSVAFHSQLFIEEHRQRNIVSCCKHFPGHGSAAADSHLGLTDVTETWKEDELVPYKKLIAGNDCKMIMSAHVFNRNLDNEYPATLSKKILNDLLREEMKFDGVIVSDAMEMKAITEHFGYKEAIEKAINAGCDILVFSNNIDTFNPGVVADVVDIIHNLVDEGKISESRIRESYERIMNVKETL